MVAADEAVPEERRLRSYLKKLGRPQINREFVQQGASRITEVDIAQVSERADDIRRQFSRNGPLGEFVDLVELLLDLVRDFRSGAYRQIPYFAIAAVAFALLYVINPLDLVPDVIPGLGQLDDAAVVAVCMLLVRQEVSDYQLWRDASRAQTEPDETPGQGIGAVGA